MSDESDSPPQDEKKDEKRRRGPDFRGAARKVLTDPGASLRRTNELFDALLDGSDKVKTEAVRQVGKEVRTYLEGLGLDDAVMHLLTNYSLEVNASLRLKPLADALEPEEVDNESEEEQSED
jgi:hypothetical protein